MKMYLHMDYIIKLMIVRYKYYKLTEAIVMTRKAVESTKGSRQPPWH